MCIKYICVHVNIKLCECMVYICKNFKILTKSVDKFLIPFLYCFLAILFVLENEEMPCLIFNHVTVLKDNMD